MKKIVLLILVISLLGFNSCEKNTTETPGQIPGMGKTPGKLQVKEPFSLPNGIHFVGEIAGMDNNGTKSGEKKPVYDAKSAYSCFGSGIAVKLKLTILNSKNYPRTVFFPKGLLWECTGGNFQHGLQIQTIWITIPANTSRTIVVDLYCLNLSVPAPDHSGTYKILGVTNSELIWNLLNCIKWRKVNYEMIYGSIKLSNETKSIGPTYIEITERLQTIVHNLTDRGIDISDNDKAFIESIPELAPEEIPVLDTNSQFPEYFEEFIVSGK